MTPESPLSENGSIKVLVVDDNPENLELLEDVLTEFGYHTALERNGVEALRRLETDDAHIVIADAMMPKMDGFQLCQELRKHPKYGRIPFIMYTSHYIGDEDKQLARMVGVDRYVVKDAGVGSLVDTVNDLSKQRYGYRVEPPDRGTSSADDTEILEKHRAVLVSKLEEKMVQLETLAEDLRLKNRQLEASERRYRALFESASIAIVVIEDEGTRILDANKEAEKLLGYTIDELRSMPGLPFSKDHRLDIRAFRGNPSFLGELQLVHREGNDIETEAVVASMVGEEMPKSILYMRDITLEKTVRQKMQQLEKMTLMGQLASGIAHEIRNPLAAVTLNLQFLDHMLKDMPSERDSIKTASEAARRIEQVVQNTLHLARLTPINEQAEQIGGSIEKALWFVKVPAQEKNITFDVGMADAMPPVTADQKQIQQVLLNLLQNAIEASPRGGTITVSTSVREIEGRMMVAVEIMDQGQGIPPEVREHLFEPFRTTKVGGTGLGLVISKYIMDRHRGKIEVNTVDPHGTCIRLIFPTYSQTEG
jgi:PAS domain S-box-containing protein